MSEEYSRDGGQQRHMERRKARGDVLGAPVIWNNMPVNDTTAMYQVSHYIASKNKDQQRHPDVAGWSCHTLA